jgi:hypothetical protein
MGRRALWLLSLPLAAGVWLSAHWLMDLLASDSHEARTVRESVGPLHLCGACVLILALLLVLIIARPVLVLGSELELRLAAGRAPRARIALLAPLPLIWSVPELALPPILASGHGERAPPQPASA